MTIERFILISLISLVLVGPGIFFTWLILKKKSWAEVIYPGALLGFVLFVFVSRLLPLTWSPLVLGLEYSIAIVIALVFRSKIKAATAGRSPASLSDLIVGLVSLSAMYIWWRASATGLLPSGPEAPANVLIAAKALADGHVPTNWLPFENIEINMATGGAFWTAVVSWITNTPVHDVYETAYPQLAFITAGLICLIGKELGEERAGYIGALIWTTLAKWGGVESLHWGNVPFMMGLTILTGFAYLAVSEKGRTRWVLSGLLLAGAMAINHNGAFIAYSFAIVLLALQKLAGNESDEATDTLKAVLLGVVLTPISIFKLIAGLAPEKIALTTNFNYREIFIPFQDLPKMIGFETTVLGVIGMIMVLRAITNTKDIVMPALAATALVLLAIFGYVWRVFSFGLYGDFAGAMFPSKFIMALSVPLSLMAGLLLVGKVKSKPAIVIGVPLAVAAYFYANTAFKFGNLVTLLKSDHYTPLFYAAFIFTTLFLAFESKRPKLVNAMTIVLALSLCLAGMGNSIRQGRVLGKTLNPSELEDFNRLKTVIPADALVVNSEGLPRDMYLYRWLPYWLWRECTTTPLPPTEEKLSQGVRFKRTWLEPGMHESLSWAHLAARPVVFIYPPYSNSERKDMTEIYESPNRKAYLYEPAWAK